jgi:hypothetical protein
MIPSTKTLVERFYYQVWNRANENAAREILHAEFRFRGSLGPERCGPDGFIEYLRSPTGRQISWSGGAFFTMDGKQITELWVLGDIDGVKRQLDAGSAADFHCG